MNTIQFSYTFESSQDHCPFAFVISVDGTAVDTVNEFDNTYSGAVDISDDAAEHMLEICMQGKTAEHTKINDTGEIVDDILVAVKNLCLDDIELGHTFLEHATYSHDFNGTQDPVTVPFAGVMGCNGVVRFKFSTPAYLWLLENL